jgi:hypothetical protein
MHTCARACATAKLESQRTAGTKTPGEGGAAAAGRTKLLLCYYRTQETPAAPEDTRACTAGAEQHEHGCFVLGRTVFVFVF